MTDAWFLIPDKVSSHHVIYLFHRSYGYEQHDIAVLFVAGFGSSMVFGTFVGGMADQFGRRLFVVIYGLTYAASCFTKRTLSILASFVQMETVYLLFSMVLTILLLMLASPQILRISIFS